MSDQLLVGPEPSHISRPVVNGTKALQIKERTRFECVQLRLKLFVVFDLLVVMIVLLKMLWQSPRSYQVCEYPVCFKKIPIYPNVTLDAQSSCVSLPPSGEFIIEIDVFLPIFRIKKFSIFIIDVILSLRFELSQEVVVIATNRYTFLWNCNKSLGL